MVASNTRSSDSPHLEGKHRIPAGRDVLSPQRQADAFKKARKATQEAAAQKKATSSQGRRDYKQCESLTVKVNVYDLVWETKDHRRGKNAGNSGRRHHRFFHSGLEIWGKEISFGHSKRYQSGVFAVKPRSAQEYMPHTRFRTTVEIATVHISRFSVDQLLSRLAAKYTSDSYDVIRNNCNHFTEELCAALCNKSIPEWINRPAKMGASTLEALALPFKAVNSFVSLFQHKPNKKRPSAQPARRPKTPEAPPAAPGGEAIDASGLSQALAQVASAAAVPESADKIGVDGVDSPKCPNPEHRSSVQNWLAQTGATPTPTPRKLPREPKVAGSPGRGGTPIKALRAMHEHAATRAAGADRTPTSTPARGTPAGARTQPIASRTRRASGGRGKENEGGALDFAAA